MISTRTTRIALALAAACSLALLGACADGTDPGGEPDVTDTTEAPEPDTGEGDGTGTDGDGEDAAPLPDAADLPLEPGATGRGLPAGVDAPADGGTGAAWTGEAGLLYVVTHGSSTCPTVPEPEAGVADGAVQVTFVEQPADQVCTMDFVPATTVVAVPAEVDASEDVTIVLGTFGEGELPALTGDGPGTPVWVGLE